MHEALPRGAWLLLVASFALAGCAPLPRASDPGPPAPPAVAGSTDASAGGASRGAPPPGDCAGRRQTEIPNWQSQNVEHLPEILQQTPPSYPEVALEAGIDGTVILQVLVCADGGLHEAKVVRSVPMLDSAAIDAVHQWTFQPATQGGEPVAAWVEARVEFKLPPKGETRKER